METQVHIPDEEYETRVQLMQPTCVAWSPLLASTAGRPGRRPAFCMLAAGTRNGRVWLWRYSPPLLSLRPSPEDEASGFQLVSKPSAVCACIEEARCSLKRLVDGGVLVDRSACCDFPPSSPQPCTGLQPGLSRTSLSSVRAALVAACTSRASTLRPSNLPPPRRRLPHSCTWPASSSCRRMSSASARWR